MFFQRSTETPMCAECKKKTEKNFKNNTSNEDSTRISGMNITTDNISVSG